jgi:DNA polymerase elongation subunit (family B)
MDMGKSFPWEKVLKKKTINRKTILHDLSSSLKKLYSELGRTPSKTEFIEASGASDYQVRLVGGYGAIIRLAGVPATKMGRPKLSPEELPQPKILIFDIETSPLELLGFGLRDQNFSLNQIQKDWSVLSWAAKWLGSPESEVMYACVRDQEDLRDDFGIVSQIWQLLDEADIVITQNGVRFDSKKLNARFVNHGFPPPSSYRHIDTLKIARKYFGFTSLKLEYMTTLLCTKYKKQKHSKFSGFELWAECLKRNPEAWDEMETYNRYDVLSLEELYLVFRRWDKTINFNVYHDEEYSVCSCGSKDLIPNGYETTNHARKMRLKCLECGAEWVSKENLLSKGKKKSLLK